jgi:predicted CoA-substrate-specific enzyme activase
MGLCLALARTYISNLGKGKEFKKPLLFQGGVAANQGMREAFTELLKLDRGELIIPTYYKEMGGIGSAFVAQELKNKSQKNVPIEELIQKTTDLLNTKSTIARVSPLVQKKRDTARANAKRTGRVHLGVDIGSVSTSIVILNQDREFLDGLYLKTGGKPITTLQDALVHFQKNNSLRDLASVGVTGSGRYLAGDFLEADVVINEIKAQAEATINLHHDVDTIFEIGGQDSKFIRLENNEIIFFDMNKVCAAGTGSFIEEQLNRLDLEMSEGIQLAFKSSYPVDLQNRCTIFMESDIVHHLHKGVPREDIVSGIMYGVAKNYLEKVVSGQELGKKLYFQGGVASNPAVIAAMENLTGQTITVTRYNEFTGAIGAALIASKRADGKRVHYLDRSLTAKEYAFSAFSCGYCSNCCEIRKVSVNEKTSHYGGMCGRWDIRKGTKRGKDFYQIRKKLLSDQLGKF